MGLFGRAAAATPARPAEAPVEVLAAGRWHNGGVLPAMDTLTLGGKLGKGGFAVCLKGTLAGRTVAVKVLHRELSRDTATVQLFVEEARLMLLLDHA